MLLKNPEFRRNLWLELSPQRLILMPLVLAVIGALTITLSEAEDMARGLLIVFSVVGAALVGAWGSFAVLASINSEVAERTWDQQRLSALSPWQMAWGKLLGASIYPWFGGILCAAVVLISGMTATDNPPRVILLLLAAILGGLALHCGLMASRLHTMDANAANNNSSVIKRLFGLFILLQILPSALFLLIGLRNNESSSDLGSWWGLPLGFSSLCLLMATLGLALGLLALWRSMSTQLMVRTTPWAWALGCTATGLIVAGFFDSSQTSSLWPALVAAVSLLATYFALFTEKNNAMVWRAVAFHAQQGNWRRMLQSLPLWPVSWLLALLFALLYTVLAHLSATTAESLSLRILRMGGYQILWMCLLHALRDAGIYLFFAWRNTTRKPIGMALLTYFTLSGILPMFFHRENGQLGLLFEPMYGLRGSDFVEKMEVGAPLIAPLAWLVMAAHLAIVGALLVWRWRQSVQLQQTAMQEP